MKELLEDWSQRPKPITWGDPLSALQARITNEVRILEALEAAGCTRIPDEPFDVAFMIEDRYRLLAGIRRNVS